MEATKRVAVGALAGGALAAAAVRRWSRADLSGRVVLVTGASRGLGLLLAREFADRGCRVAICARNGDELHAAEADLAARGAEVLAVTCDITDRDQVGRMMGQVVERFGALDVLVNNAGILQVGPAVEMTVDDFRAAVEVMQLGPVSVTLQALPHLRASQGRIANITSIGGKVPAPHLLPYVTAKFGTVGFSQGLHAELAAHGVRVTTVVPGLMRTGSHARAQFTGRAERELDWFAPAAGAPLVSVDAARAARRIVNAVAAGRAELTITPQAVIASRLAQLAPAATARLLGLVARVLPSAAAGPTPTRAGDEVAAAAPSRVRGALSTLGRRATDRLQPAARPQT